MSAPVGASTAASTPLSWAGVQQRQAPRTPASLAQGQQATSRSSGHHHGHKGGGVSAASENKSSGSSGGSTVSVLA